MVLPEVINPALSDIFAHFAPLKNPSTFEKSVSDALIARAQAELPQDQQRLLAQMLRDAWGAPKVSNEDTPLLNLKAACVYRSALNARAL